MLVTELPLSVLSYDKKMAQFLVDWEDCIVKAICLVGFLSLSKFLLKFVWVFWMFIRPPKILTTYGSWALVTGCTDGIGKALSFELAAQGLNLILVGRNPKKLQATSDEIMEKTYKKTMIKTIVIDFEKIGGKDVEERIRKGIEGLDVGVLINNVGMASPVLTSTYPGARFLHELESKGIDKMLNVNMGSFIWVTRAVLPGMLERNKGAIVNMGSASTVASPSYPLFTMYASTKAFVALFSRALSVEYQHYGIDIQCQVPMYVATKMTSMRKSLLVASAEQFSKASIRSIGYDFLCVPYWTHALQCCLLKLVPGFLITRIVFQWYLDIRRRTL